MFAKIKKEFFDCCKLFMVGVVLLTVCGVMLPVQAAIKEVPAAFIVQDYTGEMEGADYRNWKQVTRWAYRFPYYHLEDGAVLAPARKLLDVKQIDKELLDRAVKSVQSDVLVLVRVYDMTERIDTSMGSMEYGPVVKVEVEADLYCYRADTGKLLVDNVYERGVYDMGAYERPCDTIRWRLCDLVNKMEGRSLIR